MTALVAWISIDQRAPSAFYIASDSRVTWGSPLRRWDAARKLFACRRCPDIFGYSGDVVFPSLVLGQITEAADAGLIFGPSDEPEGRHSKAVETIKASFGRRQRTPLADFHFLHASRAASGPKASFRLWRLSFSASTGRWSDKSFDVPTDKSSLIVAIGSGAAIVTRHSQRWESSAQGGTSRAIFSAFCDAIRSNDDAHSGGAPQLVGMYHTRTPQAYGIVQGNQRYLNGFPLPPGQETNSIEWRDELFQRMDGSTLQVLPGAQRHARPR